MKKDFVSIIIPVYNSEKNLSRCLDSCLIQKYNNIEIICVNDGSTDNSQEILNDYSKKDKRIKVIVQENQGVSIARNNALKNSNGEFITFLDSDDFLFDDSIEKMVDIIKKEKVDIVRTNYMRVYEDGKCKKNAKKIIHNQFYNEQQIRSDILNRILSGELSSHLWLLCIKRNIIFDNNIEFIPGIKMMQDKLFYLKIFSKIHSFYQSEEITYNYYCNLSSTIMSKEKCFMRIDFILKVAEICENIISQNNLLNKVDLNNLYNGHFSMICRELRYCDNTSDIIKKIKSVSDNEMYNKFINSASYKKSRIDDKLILFLLRRKWYKLLKLYILIILRIKKIKR